MQPEAFILFFSKLAGALVGGNYRVHCSGADAVLFQRTDAGNRRSAGAADFGLELAWVLAGGKRHFRCADHGLRGKHQRLRVRQTTAYAAVCQRIQKQIQS